MFVYIYIYLVSLRQRAIRFAGEYLTYLIAYTIYIQKLSSLLFALI